VTVWHLSNGLLLNLSKTEALITGTRSQVDSTADISIGDTVVSLSTAIRVLGVTSDMLFYNNMSLGVTVDQYLTFDVVDDQLTKVVSSCNYHIRSLRHIRHLIN